MPVMNYFEQLCWIMFFLIPCQEGEEEDVEEVVYATPKALPNAYLTETFDDLTAFEKTWIKSEAKKDGVDENIAKYDGQFKP